MDLQQHPRAQVVLAQGPVHADHGLLDDVRRRTLDGGVQRHALRGLAGLAVVAREVREVAAAPVDRLGVALGAGFLDDAAQEVPHTAEAFEVAAHHGAGLVHADVQLLGQAVGTEPVHQAVAHGLDLGTHLRGDVLRGHVEHAGTHEAVQVLATAERLDQALVPGQVRHDPHLDLGVVGGHEALERTLGVLAHHEHVADALTLFGAHGDVLQVGSRGGQPSGGRHGLLVRGVDAPVLGDRVPQPGHDLLELGVLAPVHERHEEP